MPNQSDPNSNKPAVDQTPGQPTVPIASIQPDLPPLPPDFQSAEPDNQAVPPINPSINEPAKPPPTSAGPPDMPSVISTNAKKKFGGGRIVATILGIFLLVGGIGAGIFLTQQKQLFQQKATYNDTFEGCIAAGNTPAECSGLPTYCEVYDCTNDVNNCGSYGRKCGNGEICEGGACEPNPITDTCGRNEDPGAPVCCTGSCGGTIVCEGSNRLECNTGGQHCTIDADGCTDGSPPPVEPPGSAPPSAPPTPTPTPPAPLAPQCIRVKAYSASWTLLTPAQLSELKPNDKIYFCVKGAMYTNTPGSFDKAQFKINDTVISETTLPPGFVDETLPGITVKTYCQDYTIKSTDTTVGVKAKIHHAPQGWFGETF